MGLSVKDIFDDRIIERIKREIHDSYGNEVLFFGWIGEDGKIGRIEVVARGNDECVSFPVENSYLADVVIHNHPGGVLVPSDADMAIASRIAQKSVGFVIIDNDVTTVYVAVEPVKKKVIHKLDPEICISYVKRGGALEKVVDDFEERDAQKLMIELVCDSFNQSGISLIEAGTGIGKSFAYLIPSIEWAILNRERVVISTNTINLQEQLLKKDIPALTNVIDKEFRYVLMKGRGNYICLNRVMEVSQDMFSFIDEDEQDQFNSILEWINKTQDGTVSDLPFTPKQSFWEKINSKSETCLGAKCRYFSKCFFNRVKKEALKAHIIITNHHYFLADSNLMEAGGSVLPNFDRVVFDEAHRLEDSATSFFTKELNRASVVFFLNQIYRSGKRGKDKGYFAYLRNRSIIDNEAFEMIKRQVSDIKENADNLFSALSSFIKKVFEDMADTEEYPVIEVDRSIQEVPEWHTLIIPAIDGFYNSLRDLENSLMDIRGKLEKVGKDVQVKQIDGFILRIMDVLQTLDIFLNDEKYDYVRWIENRGDMVRVKVSLIDVGQKLREMIYEKSKSVVLTSATLTVNGKFDFLKSRLGIDYEVSEAVIDSPFDYGEQMEIIVQSDLAEPNNPGYVMGLSSSVESIIKKMNGSTLVLFTSYLTLNAVFDLVKEKLKGHGYALLKQGNASRHRLLSEFKHQKRAVLFGTESFWEGIDVPGEDLRCVVITRLPFKVPRDPIIKARLKQVEMAGKNSFTGYLLPLAVLKVKQGVGRLIRKKSDRGVVIILDRRIISKNYGGIFFRSLPESHVLTLNQAGIIEELERFFNRP